VAEDKKAGRPSYQDLQAQIETLKSELEDVSEEPKGLETTDLERQLSEAQGRAETAERHVKEIEDDLKHKEGLNKARMNHRLRTFPGVDWSKPAYKMIAYERLPDGKEAVQDGEKKFEIIGADGRKKRDASLVFQDGLCVTNDLSSARAYAARGWVLELSPVEYPGEREQLTPA